MPPAFSHLIPLAFTSCKPRSNAQYSAVLFVLWKSSLKEKGKTSPDGEMRTTPTPEPEFKQLPSNSKIHKASSELTKFPLHDSSGKIM